jgi:hypothetical protein
LVEIEINNSEKIEIKMHEGEGIKDVIENVKK